MKHNLLVVDDESIGRKGMRSLLQKRYNCFTFFEAENGKKALEILQGHTIDVLITDIKMPFMNGIELIRSIRENSPTLRILICSAYGEFEYAQEAVRHHVFGYILKPVHTDELYTIMDEVVKDISKKEGEAIRDKVLPLALELLQKHKQESVDTAVDMVLDIIHAEYYRDIGLEYLAQRVNLSPNYLSQLFKKNLGVSPVKFISKYRIEKAKHYLATSNMKIVDISKTVGFSNATYFVTVFKQETGKTPAKYRQSAHVSRFI